MATRLTRQQAAPPGPKDVLGLRSLRRFRQNAPAYLLELARRYGDMVRFFFGPFPGYLVSHPDWTHQVYVEQAALFHKPAIMKQVFKPWLGESLLTSDGDFWLRQRRLIQPAFHSRRIESYAQIMVAQTERALQDWRAGQERDIHHDMMALTMRIVSLALFDIDVSDEVEEVGRAIEAGLEITNAQFNRLVQIPDWLPTRENRRARRAQAVIDGLVMRLIRERRALGRAELAARGDLLSMLLLAADEHGRGMSDQQARNEIYTLFLAGHETTAVTLSWAWHLLAQHPQAEARLHEELRAALAGRPPALADLPGLTYTDWIIKETLRLYPPAWVTSREAQQEVVIGGYTLPRGASVFISPWVSHRDPRYFEQPEAFLPERWAGDFEKRLPKGAYIPFAAGPRICIGNTFALMEARLILATIAQRYRLRSVAGHVVEPQPLITLRPKNGLRMRVEALPAAVPFNPTTTPISAPA